MLKVPSHNDVCVFEQVGVLNEVRSFTSNTVCDRLKIKDTCLLSLKNIIKSASENILKNNVYIDYCWVVDLKPGENGVSHNHPTYPLVGVYYVNVDEQTGNLVFDSLNYSIFPKNDMLVLFSGALIHSIERNKSTNNRVSIGTHIKLTEIKNV